MAKLGELLSEFFTKTLGVSADNAELKIILNDSELANQEVGADGMGSFMKFFITHSQAKRNPAIEKHFQEKVKTDTFAEVAKVFEDALIYNARDNGMEKGPLDEFSKTITNRDQKISDRLKEGVKVLSEFGRKPGDNKEAETKIKTLEDQVLSLKREKTKIEDDWTQKHTSEIGKMRDGMTSSEISNYLKSKYKFRKDIPKADQLLSGEIQTWMDEHHIAKNTTGEGFGVFDKKSPDKKAFDDRGVEIDFDKLVLSKLGPEWFEKEAGNGNGADGKRNFSKSSDAKPGDQILSTEAKQHNEAFDEALSVVTKK